MTESAVHNVIQAMHKMELRLLERIGGVETEVAVLREASRPLTNGSKRREQVRGGAVGGGLVAVIAGLAQTVESLHIG